VTLVEKKVLAVREELCTTELTEFGSAIVSERAVRMIQIQ
jgi:hypothetical protein